MMVIWRQDQTVKAEEFYCSALWCSSVVTAGHDKKGLKDILDLHGVKQNLKHIKKAIFLLYLFVKSFGCRIHCLSKIMI